jgi:8-oxo-dGTP pyrophosphatase MutT (NUDIX family)
MVDGARAAEAGLAPVLRALAAAAVPSSDHDLTPGVAPAPAALRPAAVLVALQPGPAGPEVVLTRRAATLRHHPGQIALPGGKLDPSDPGPVTAALREAQEEIGLDPAAVEPLGLLAPHATVTGFAVTPVVGWLAAPCRPRIAAEEVEEAFAVPLAHLADPARYRIERRRWRGVWRNYYAVPWGPYYIWGATARILHRFADAPGAREGR